MNIEDVLSAHGVTTASRITKHKAEMASTSAAGHVQLNDTVVSTSTTQAATANAVKVAYDKGNDANTNLTSHADNNTIHITSTERTSWNGKLDATGNAASASKWSTARTVSLSGDASGSASIDGSANATINVTVADDSHNHVIANVDGLQTELDSKETPAGAQSKIEQNSYKTSKLNKDANGVFTTVEARRKSDNTLAIRSVLSGGTSPRYTTRTIAYYQSNGTTVAKTETYTLTYDADGDLISEV